MHRWITPAEEIWEGYNKFCHQESYIKKNPSHDINCTHIVRLFPTEYQIPIPPDKPEHSDYLLW